MLYIDLNEKLQENVYKRHYGTTSKDITIEGTELEKHIRKRLLFWTSKQERVERDFKDHFQQSKVPKGRGRSKKRPDQPANLEVILDYVAEEQIEMYKMVSTKWREIAKTLRDNVYEETEIDEEQIDVFDLKLKEWGFTCRHVFGGGLGLGDYGHLLIDHAEYLLRRFRSFREYSNQGFEALHKLQRVLYARATNHDQSGPGSSILQMLSHTNAEHLLSLRYAFRQAESAISEGTSRFYFRGCGWKAKQMTWTMEEMTWIQVMNGLFDSIFGPDSFTFEYPGDGKNCVVAQSSLPEFVYNHSVWEEYFDKKYIASPTLSSGNSTPNWTTTSTTDADKATHTTATEVGKATSATATEVGKATSATATKVGKATSATATKVGKATSATATKVGKATSATATKVGKATSATATEVGKATSATATEVGKATSAADVKEKRTSIERVMTQTVDLDDEDDDDDVQAVAQVVPGCRVLLQYPLGERGAVTIYDIDLECLEMGEWLNDSIIDFFLKYLARNISFIELKEKIHVFSSFFYTKLIAKEKLPDGQLVIPRDPKKRYKQARSFTRRVDIFEKEFLIIPVCRGSHWFLVLVWNPRGILSTEQEETRTTFFILDSLSWGHGMQPDAAKYIEVDYLYSFFQQYVLQKYPGHAVTNSAKCEIHIPLVPQQENGCDCGIFLLMFVETILTIKCDMAEMLQTRKPLGWFRQKDAAEKRDFIKNLILSLGQS